MSKKVDKSYYLLHKPYGYLCQFTGEPEDKLLKDLFKFPKDVYSVGRLDKDSEGLLILTNDNAFKTRILSPNFHVKKTYWVQVEGAITDKAIAELQAGTIVISHKGKKHQVAKSSCRRINSIDFPDRLPPIRQRASIPTSWIELQITEGKNRQVRKMTAAVGYPTLRLIRYAIDGYSLEGLNPGDVKSFVPIS